MSDGTNLSYVIDSFQRGMVTNIDSSDKDAASLENIKNARIDVEEGSLVKRLQATFYNEVPLSGGMPIKGGIRFYPNISTKELLIGYDTYLLKGDDSLGTFSHLKTGLTSNKRFSFVQYKGKVYCFNGEDANLVYDGTNITDMGCPAPASVPTCALISGSITGTFKYKVTYLYDGYQESNPSGESSSVSPSGQGVRVTIPTSSDPRVTARKIYRTIDGGSVFYYVGTVSDNTTTTYDDNTADSSLTIQVETDHDEPPVWKMAVLHKDHIFGIRPNTSEVDVTSIIGYNSMPDIYSATDGYIMVSENDGANNIAIAAIESGVLVFKRSGVFLINTSTGNNILQWSIDKIDIRGICAPYSCATTPRGVIALSLEKEGELDLRLFTATGSQSLGWRIKDILNSINHIYYDEVVAGYVGGRYYLSFIDNYSGLSYNHKMLVMQFNDDFSKFGYTLDDAKISSFIYAFGEGDFGQIYAGMSNIGKVLRLETRSQDLIHRTSTDVNTGTLTRLTETGTEEYPVFNLDASAFSPSLFSNTLINDLTDFIDNYNTIDDTIDNCGYITSEVLYIGASAFYKAFWEVNLGTNGGTAFRMRVGDTESACAAASWSSWFTDPEGSDISSISPNAYLQYQLLIASDDLPDANTYLYRDDFVVKISCGLGSPYEDYINFLLDTGKIDLTYKDRIKVIHSIAIEYETSNTTLNVYLAKDDDSLTLIEAVDTDTYPNIRELILPFDYVGEFARLQVQEQSLEAVKIKSIRIRFDLLPEEAEMLLRGA